MTAIVAFLSLVLAFAVPAAMVGLIGLGVARGRAKRNGRPPEEVTRRGLRAFWLTLAITFAIELITFGACVALLVNSGL
jgi:hypothetical protein